jgi:IS5 family transposase
MFDDFLADAGYRAKKGQIVDASFVEVPRQRNTKDENDTISKGETPADWNESKRRQKDMDAAWTKKHNETHFGYKNHVNVDVQHKMIRAFSVTPASVHDSQELEDILDKDNGRKALWGDSAYSSEDIRKKLKRKRIVSHVNKKGYRSHPLSKFQQNLNRMRSKVRARVEHVFARIGQMIGGTIRCIGQPRAATRIGIMNLVYNMSRYAYLENCK